MESSRPQTTPPALPRVPPWRHYTVLIVFGIVTALLCVYYWYLHRKPFTQNAFLTANVRPVTPLVAGYLTEVFVRNHQFVRKGEPLFSVYRVPYELKRQQLQWEMRAQEAALKAMLAKEKAASANLRGERAANRNRWYLARQAAILYREDVSASQAYAEEMQRAAELSDATVEAAACTREALQHQEENLRAVLQELRQQLKQAEIQLEQTTVYALSDGVVSNMHLSPGGYCTPGEVLFAFVDTREWWVQANFEETDLARLRPGQKAKIWLWQYPGKCFHGEVTELYWNVERRSSASGNGVSVVANENQWFLLPQRFPVQIRVLDPDPRYPFHLGCSAFVQVDVSAELFPQLVWRVFRWR